MNATKTTYKAWWRLSKRAWLIVAAASAVSLACCIEPTLPDNALWLADFRMWPRWYFIEPVIVFAFSIRWFLLYAAFHQGELDEHGRREAKRFTALTGFVSMFMFLVTVLDRLDLLRYPYHAIWRWFEFGTFSLLALATFLVLLASLILFISLFRQWIAAFQPS